MSHYGAFMAVNCGSGNIFSSLSSYCVINVNKNGLLPLHACHKFLPVCGRLFGRWPGCPGKKCNPCLVVQILRLPVGSTLGGCRTKQKCAATM